MLLWLWWLVLWLLLSLQWCEWLLLVLQHQVLWLSLGLSFDEQGLLYVMWCSIVVECLLFFEHFVVNVSPAGLLVLRNGHLGVEEGWHLHEEDKWNFTVW